MFTDGACVYKQLEVAGGELSSPARDFPAVYTQVPTSPWGWACGLSHDPGRGPGTRPVLHPAGDTWAGPRGGLCLSLSRRLGAVGAGRWSLSGLRAGPSGWRHGPWRASWWKGRAGWRPQAWSEMLMDGEADKEPRWTAAGRAGASCLPRLLWPWCGRSRQALVLLGVTAGEGPGPAQAETQRPPWNFHSSVEEHLPTRGRPRFQARRIQKDIGK